MSYNRTQQNLAISNLTDRRICVSVSHFFEASEQKGRSFHSILRKIGRQTDAGDILVESMKIICAGFWKTGTKSLAQALKILGYKVYDYDDQLFLLRELWERFFDGRVTDEFIRDKLADVDVIIDGPVIAFWEEIHKAIPEAKVILTTRDEESWYKSLKKMMTGTPTLLKLVFNLMILTPTGGPFVRLGQRVATFCMGVEAPFTGLNYKMNNPRLYKSTFRKHNIHVIRSVPQAKLLVLNVGEGWEPLCKFLGEEVPNTVYPHKNKDGGHFTKEGGPQNPALQRVKVELAVVLAVSVTLVAILAYQMFHFLF